MPVVLDRTGHQKGHLAKTVMIRPFIRPFNSAYVKLAATDNFQLARDGYGKLILSLFNFSGDTGMGGTSGAVPAPLQGSGTTQLLNAEGVFKLPDNFNGSSSGSAGAAGYIPAPQVETFSNKPWFIHSSGYWMQLSGELKSIFEGRLSASSSYPLMASDVTDAATLYLTAYKGNKISLIDPSTGLWTLYTLGNPNTGIKGYPSMTDLAITFTGSYTASGTTVTIVGQDAYLKVQPGMKVSGNGVTSGALVKSVTVNGNTLTVVVTAGGATNYASASYSFFTQPNTIIDVFAHIVGGVVTLEYVPWVAIPTTGTLTAGSAGVVSYSGSESMTGITAKVLSLTGASDRYIQVTADELVSSNHNLTISVTSASYTNPTLQNIRRVYLSSIDGVICLADRTDWRYVGTVHTSKDSAATSYPGFTDSLISRSIYNYYNRVPVPYYTGTTTSHTYASATPRAWGGLVLATLGFCLGNPEKIAFNFSPYMRGGTAGSNYWARAGVVHDNQGMTITASDIYTNVPGNVLKTQTTRKTIVVNEGAHFLRAWEDSAGTSTYTSFYLGGYLWM